MGSRREFALLKMKWVATVLCLTGICSVVFAHPQTAQSTAIEGNNVSATNQSGNVLVNQSDFLSPVNQSNESLQAFNNNTTTSETADVISYMVVKDSDLHHSTFQVGTGNKGIALFTFDYRVGDLAADPSLLKPSRHSIRAKLFQLLCVRTEEMGGVSSSNRHQESINRSNAANSSTQTLSGIQTRSSHHHHKHSSKHHGPSTSHSRRSSTTNNRHRTERLPQNLEGLVVITSLSATIDKKPTSIDERSTAVLKYRTPHFRASASVRIPQIPEKETWQIGWIQACTDMVFLNTYGQYGVSSWEFPELKTGGYMMISDSDGRNYPWYGSRTEVVTVAGPTKAEQIVTVTMNDNFYPHITWSVPLRNHRTPALTHVRRTQGFYTWLVAKCVDTNQIYILKTIRWNMHLEIAVDPSQPLGQRARLLGTGIQNQPSVLNYNVEIAPCALHPPNANSAQNLIWYPALGSAPPEIIVPSKWNPEEKKVKETSDL